ncbi:MAG: integrin alpha [Planctomycetes bacterium]|nr:integrin alpha [Planctomycetota bacterium]
MLVASFAPRAIAQESDYDYANGDRFGSALVEIGDQDRDGVRDLAVSCPAVYGELGGSRVWIFSGRSGAVIAQVGETFESFVGRSLANAGDVDLDGADDVVFSVGADRAEVWSVAHGLLLALSAPRWEHMFETTVGSPGDVDTDGASDVVAGAALWSGCDGRLLRRLDSIGELARDSTAMSIVPDLDGDGCSEFAFVVVDTSATHIVVVSSATGVELFRTPPIGVPGTKFVPQADGSYRQAPDFDAPERLRVQSAFASDLDGDGRQDLAACSIELESWRVLGIGTSSNAAGSVFELATGPKDGWEPRLIGGLASGQPPNALLLCSTFMWVSAQRRALGSDAIRWEIDAHDGHTSEAWGSISASASVEDLDGDGCREIALGVVPDGDVGFPGYVQIRSGRDGVVLRELDRRSALLQVHARR